MGLVRRQLDTLVDSVTGNFAGFVDGDGTIRYVPGMDTPPAAGGTPVVTDVNGFAVVNLIPRRNTLANLLALAGGVGEISEATDWNALVQHNGVAGQAVVLYCKPKRCSVFSAVPQSATTAVALAIQYGGVQIDPYSLWNIANPTRINVPAGATKFRLFASTEFAANATGNRQVSFKDNTGTAAPGLGNQAAGAGALTVQAHSIVGNVGAITYFETYALQNSGAALNVGGFGNELTYFEAEFWVE